MKESYKKDRYHNYLILETDENFQENEYSIKMITYNQIPGLLKCEVRKVNGSVELYYDITAKQCAASLFERRLIGYDDIKQMLLGLKKALEGAAGYLLDENDFLIDPEHFYMESESQEIFLCYVPGRRGNFQKEFQNFAEYILRRLDHEEEKAVILGYEVYRRAMDENGSIDYVLQLAYHDIELREEEQDRATCLKDKKRERKKEYVSEKAKPQKDREEKKKKWAIWCLAIFGFVGICTVTILISLRFGWNLTRVGGGLSVSAALTAYTISFIKNRHPSKYKKTQRKSRKTRKQSKTKTEWESQEIVEESEKKRENSTKNHEEKISAKRELIEQERIDHRQAEKEIDEGEEETQLLNFGETVLLNGGKLANMHRLVSQKDKKFPDIYIFHTSILVGKRKEQADVVLDDEHISRIHARIERSGEDIYVTDLNSTNGTFVNGERLRANERRRLCNLDEVGFASIMYQYEAP